jgi:hypothetical protein
VSLMPPPAASQNARARRDHLPVLCGGRGQTAPVGIPAQQPDALRRANQDLVSAGIGELSVELAIVVGQFLAVDPVVLDGSG